MKIFRGQFHTSTKCSRIGIELGTISRCRYFIKRNRLGRIRLWKNNEWDRIMREYKEQQQADLLYQLKIKKNENKEGNANDLYQRGARKQSRTPRSESNVTIH